MIARPTIVVGFKDSEDSRSALSMALDLARRLDASVNVAHVATLEDYPIDPDAEDWELEGWKHLGDIRTQVETLLAAFPDLDVSFIERRGDPATVLHDIAEACDALMVVIGLPHHGAAAWITDFLARPVSKAVTRHARRPVLLVPEPPHLSPTTATHRGANSPYPAR